MNILNIKESSLYIKKFEVSNNNLFVLFVKARKIMEFK